MTIITPEALTPETGTPGNQNNFGGPGSISPYNDVTPETGTPGNFVTPEALPP